LEKACAWKHRRAPRNQSFFGTKEIKGAKSSVLPLLIKSTRHFGPGITRQLHHPRLYSEGQLQEEIVSVLEYDKISSAETHVYFFWSLWLQSPEKRFKTILTLNLFQRIAEESGSWEKRLRWEGTACPAERGKGVGPHLPEESP